MVFMNTNPDINERLRRVFSGSGFDSAIIMNTNSKDSNFLYLTGFTSGVFEDTILLAKKNGMALLTGELEYDIAIEQAPKSMEVKIVRTEKDVRDNIRSFVGNGPVGLDYGFLPYSYAAMLKRQIGKNRVVDATEQFEKAREIKSEFEIGAIRKAAKITLKSLGEIEGYFKHGMTEKQLRARFEFLLGENGGEGLAFDSIVSFGTNAALPHHTPDDTKLKANEFVLLDVGARYRNYCSDITRTFVFKPERTTLKYKRMKAIIDTVKEAQQMAMDYIKDGADGSSAHKAAADFINTANNGIYKGRFIHSLGHQIGIDVHDGIGLGLRSKRLHSGMIVSDEPGIYITGFGGARFEDDVLIKKGKSIMLR